MKRGELTVVIKREYLDDRTLGSFTIYEDKQKIGSLKSLEQDWQNNQRNISCIPEGIYDVEPNDTIRHPDTYRVLDVDSRSGILIHIGNYPRHSEGCILVGLRHADIDRDGIMDVASSTLALEELNDLIGNNNFKLVVC